MNKIFGFPTFIRFSWSTVPKMLADKHGVPVIWNEDEDTLDIRRKMTPKKHAKFESMQYKRFHIENVGGFDL